MKIANWEQWQPLRKDRGTPPWIKLYRNLFSNEEWYSLSDSEKGQLVSIWILGADKKGVIPDSSHAIQKMCGLDSLPNINKFIELGFLVANMATTGRQHGDNLAHQSRVEKSRVEKSRGEESRPEERKALSSKLDDTSKKILDELNTKAGKNFKPVDSNLKLIRARLSEGHSIDDFFWVIETKVEEWSTDAEFSKYLRPATLFNAEKFNQYIGERGAIKPIDKNKEFNRWLDEPDIIEGECDVVN